MKDIILVIVVFLIMVFVVSWLIQGNGFFLYKVFAPKQAAVQREVFENTPSYVRGKIIFVGESVGYAIPYSTQYTNPEKLEFHNGPITLPQADPNCLFMPESAEGSWVLLKDPNSDGVKPVYFEPRIIVSPFKLKID